MSILENKERIGRFTSSEIFALTTNGKTKGSFGEKFYTYVNDKNMERKLGRSISNESNARPLSWGKICEQRVFDLLDIEYYLCSNDTIEHPHIKCWVGSPDARKLREKIVSEIKCPETLKSFCQLVEPIYSGLTGMEAINHIRENHKDGEKYYYQMVSNAILTNSEYAELIVYIPYQKELEQIKELCREKCDPKFNWILNAEDIELPYLIEGGYYKNLNIIQFQVPQADKEFLTDRVLEAEKLLIKI